MKEPVSAERFALLVEQAGLTKLNPTQTATLREGYRFIERMAANVRRPRDRSAEPAHIFTLPQS